MSSPPRTRAEPSTRVRPSSADEQPAAAFSVDLGGGRSARGTAVTAWPKLPAAMDLLGLGAPRPVVVVVGGADLADGDQIADLSASFDALVPVMAVCGATGVDGGTDAGVIAAFGTALAAGEAYTLLGVVARGTVRLPDEEAGPGRSSLEPHHSHVLLVPGRSWGDESRWLARAATVLAAGRPSLTVVANGGEVTYDDVAHSVAEGRLVIALDGSGRTADDLAAAVRGRTATPRAVALGRTGLVLAHDATDDVGLGAQVLARLRGPGRRPAEAGRGTGGAA